MAPPQKLEIKLDFETKQVARKLTGAIEELTRELKKGKPGDYHISLPTKTEEQKDEGEKVTHNEDTLVKVHQALRAAGVVHHAARLDIVSQLQNAGILFRERAN